MLQRILAIGTNPKFSEETNDKIQITNFVCIFYAFLSIPFTVVTTFLIPSITYIPPLFFGVALFGIFLNGIGALNVSRITTYIGLTSVYLFYAAMIIPNGEIFMTSLFAIFMLFIPLPVILYDLQERLALFVSILIMSVIFFSSFYLIDLVSVDVEPVALEIYRNGWMGFICFATGFFGLIGSLFFLKISIAQAQAKTTAFLELAQAKSNALALSEQNLLANMAEIEQAREADHKRQWVNEGLTKFAVLLRKNNDDIKILCSDVLTSLIQYVGANQGGIFLAKSTNEREIILELTACNAYNRKKFLKKEVLIQDGMGEGLLGQVYLEKQKIYLTEVPQDYLNITSGLGEASPQVLLILPLKTDEQIYGVIEIAAFKIFDKSQLELMEKVADSIAVTIALAQINQQTRQLLAQTQEQAEQLRAQEEELRQNLEELQTTQEAMSHKQLELEAINSNMLANEKKILN